MTASPGRRLVVVGAGAMGVWTALLARRAGWDVTLLDAWGVGHPRATSGDETRATRASHGADELYTRWSRRALDQWKALGHESGDRLFLQSGVLWFARRADGFEAASEPTLRLLGVPVERLTPDEVERRWPVVSAADLAFGLLEPEGGVVMARRAIQAAVRRLVQEGGRFDVVPVKPPHEASAAGRAVIAARASRAALDAVDSADGRSWSADAFVFACGPWLRTLFPDLVGEILRVTKQDLVFFGPPAGDDRYRAERLPVWSEFDAPAYGVPIVDQRGFKVGHDEYGRPFDPTDGERVADAAVITHARGHLSRRFPAMADAPVVETRVCQYEVTPDTHFILDAHPAWSNVWLAGGGSGHGFKHGPSIGAYLVGLLDGRAPHDLEGDAAARFRLGARMPGPGVRSAGHTTEAAGGA